MPAYLPVLPHSATTALAVLAVTHPFGARNLALVLVATFLAALGLTMWVGARRDRRRGRR